MPSSLLVIRDTGMAQPPFSRSSQSHPRDRQTITTVWYIAQMKAARRVEEGFLKEGVLSEQGPV